MAKKIEYDADVIEQFAADLYTRARSLTLTYAFGLGLLALFASAAVFAEGGALWLVGVFTVIGAAAGYSIGQSKSFQLKLDAQTALAQVQIEKNTRRTTSAA